MRVITLKTTAASGGRAFPVDDDRRGGTPPDLPLGPSGDGHAVFYRITAVPGGMPLAKVMRLFGGADLGHAWEVPFERLAPGGAVTQSAWRTHDAR